MREWEQIDWKKKDRNNEQREKSNFWGEKAM